MDGKENEGVSPAVKAAAGVGALGCLSSPILLVGGAVVIIVIGGLGILLMPLIILILIFGGGGSAQDQQDTGEQVLTIAQGDGKGTLDTSRVPSEMSDQLKDSGAECDTVSAVILASQIKVHANWEYEKGKGTDREGLSQLPRHLFDQYAEDANDNDETSPLEGEDSIAAQAGYFCALADQVNGIEGNKLDLTLAAYYGGIEAVRSANGMPEDSATQNYVAEVRSNFASFMGIGAPPTSYPTPTASASASEPATE